MPDAANDHPQRRIDARRVLDEHECMVLSGANRDAFLNAVSKPPAPTAKLVAALCRHRDAIGGR